MTALERLQARIEAQKAAAGLSAGASGVPSRPAPGGPSGIASRPAPGAVGPGNRTGTGGASVGLAARPAAALGGQPGAAAPARPPLGLPARPVASAPSAAPRPALPSPARAPLAAPAARPPLGSPGAAASRPTTEPERPRRPVPPMVVPTLAEIDQTVDHAAYEAYSDAVKRLLGFDLLQYKRPQVWRRSNSFAKQKGFDTVLDLCEACKTDLELRTELRDMITINVSEFFRNPEAWELVRTRALPDLLRAGRPIRFWSAGCSLGYEPYTFAMMVKEAGGGADAKILATDIDETILAQARASAYSEIQMVGLSPARRARFFEASGDRWVVKPELRSMVQWKRQDLLRDPFPSDLDLIACRNVVIYFTDAAKDVLYRRFADALRAGGFLFIGATEAISDWRAFGLTMVSSGLYRKSG